MAKMDKTMGKVLDTETYPSTADKPHGGNHDFEGTGKSLPKKETNPIFGQEGKLPIHSVKKTK